MIPNLSNRCTETSVNARATKLQAQAGNDATVGRRNIAVTDADPFRLDGLVAETALATIRGSDPAWICMMDRRQVLRGHVDSLGLRSPVRIRLEAVRSNVRLVAGLTIMAAIDRRSKDRQ